MRAPPMPKSPAVKPAKAMTATTMASFLYGFFRGPALACCSEGLVNAAAGTSVALSCPSTCFHIPASLPEAAGCGNSL